MKLGRGGGRSSVNLPKQDSISLQRFGILATRGADARLAVPFVLQGGGDTVITIALWPHPLDKELISSPHLPRKQELFSRCTDKLIASFVVHRHLFPTSYRVTHQEGTKSPSEHLVLEQSSSA